MKGMTPIENADAPVQATDRLADPPAEKLVVFLLDERRFALRLASVERVLSIVEITPLPKAPETVLGVVDVQGTIIPVFDTRRRFRLPVRDVELTDQLLLARTSRRRVALVVDDVSGLIDHPTDAVITPEQILPGLEYVAGVVKLPEGLVLIHDLDSFLSLDEEAALDRALRASAPTRS